MLSAVQRFTMLDYPGKVACIAFTPGCNMRCGFCHNPEFVLPEKIRKVKSSFISEAAFFQFLQKRKALLEGVVVSGGEPTLWRDLPDFLGEIRKRGFLVKLDTNGNHPEALEKILKKGLADYIAMDVKTSLEEYPALVGPNVKKENILRSIRLLKSGDVAYEFRSTLIREHHTPPILEAMRELLTGAEQLFLQTFRPSQTLNPVFASFHPFHPEEMKSLSHFFQTVVSRVGIRS